MTNLLLHKKSFYKKSLWLITASLLAVQTTSAVKEEYPLIDQDSTEVEVSTTGMNRLSVKDDRIAKIVLSDERLQWELDEDKGQLFFQIHSKQKNPKDEKPIALTLLTENGLTHDVSLIPNDCEAKTIIFEPEVLADDDDEEGGQGDRMEPVSRVKNPHASPSFDGPLNGSLNNSLSGASDSYTDQLTTLMHAMVNQTHLSGFKLSSFYWSDREYKEKKLSIKPLKIYKNAHFEGKVYEIKNVGSDPVILREKDFAKKHDCAIAFSQDHLDKGGTLRLYVVSRKA